MRILVVGAGAIGGYFGARLVQAGRDVTFLVRPARAAALNRTGLIVKSKLGDATLAKPALVTADQIKTPFDLIILSCKAYDLESALDAIAPAVGPGSTILPLLNGMTHLDTIATRFGADSVLGGQCVIAATLDDNGAILHLNESHGLTYGERAGGTSPRIARIASVFEGANFEARASETIALEMWEKWIFLASLASATCLMRAPVGAIVAAPGGVLFMTGMLDECRGIATAAGFPPRAETVQRLGGMLTAQDLPLTASMARDIQRGGKIEADHIVGDLIRRAEAASPAQKVPLLQTAYIHLKAYERQRAPTAGA